MADYDIVVVGAGGAGLTAAVFAHDLGASVLVVESETEVGGATRLSGGVVFAANTSVQRACGFEDSADALFKYYMDINQWKMDASLVRAYADGSGAMVEWLLSIGCQIPAKLQPGIVPEGGLAVQGIEWPPRGHCVAGGGASIGAALEQQRRARGIDLALATRVDRLLTSNGRVTGIRAGDQEISAGGVVITAGGFSHNKHMMQRFYPDAVEAGPMQYLQPTPFRRGDGIAMGEEVGADIAGWNRGLLMYSGKVSHGYGQDLPPGWIMMVNEDGRRFINEANSYILMPMVFKQQPGHHGWAIFDEATRLAMDPDQVQFVRWNSRVIEEEVAAGNAIRGETLDELAYKAGIFPGALRTTTDRYNADVAKGEDTLFFKPKAHLRPVSTGPFYAIEIRPAGVAVTGTGLRIDVPGHVLDKSDRIIPGLYAAGETTGGVKGEVYAGGGNSVGQAVIFGKIVAETAVKEVLGR